jgi:hypothetical protein
VAGAVQPQYALPADGVELTPWLDRLSPLTIALADSSDGVPAINGWPAVARLRDTMPTPGATSDGTVVRWAIVLPQRPSAVTRSGSERVEPVARVARTER